jgi:GNAT superfamily N-acetyltransferase
MQANLDRPIWSALNSKQTHLGQANALACLYDADVAPFAAVAHETPDAFHALRELLAPEQQAALLSFEPLPSFDSLHVTPMGTLHQMIAPMPGTAQADDRIERLKDKDVPDMLALVDKTRPGPFAKRTIEMGHYIGIREAGRLIAMAGERMTLDGYVEVSAVCVDDAWRGKGIAARLMNILHGEIAQRGMTPFLHVFTHNPAVSVYERLGYEVRRTFHLTRIKRAG